MRKVLLSAVVLIAMVLPVSAVAQDGLDDARILLEKDHDLDAFQEAIDLCTAAADSQPESFEANWMAAKAYRLYADEVKQRQMTGWQDVCREYGKKGMGYGEKAVALEPEKVDGHFWYGTCVGSYSDGVSIFTALKEGLKDKTQTSLETAYEIDKLYNEAGPILAVGRFWSVLPWPLKDKKKALAYIEEYHPYYPDKPEGLVYLGEAYLDVKEKDKAKAVLQKAAASGETYYSDWAKRLLADM
jgi:tetratricopeptide (TPR) repeat protein